MKKKYTKPSAELINFETKTVIMDDVGVDGPGFGDESVPEEW